MNATNSTTNYMASSYSALTWDLWLRIVVAFLGIIANLLNTCVLMNTRKLNDITYKYMLANAIANIVYLSLSLASVFYYYCTTCPSSQSYLAGVFSISLTFYVFDSLKLLHVLLEITISMRIYLILINSSAFNRISYKLVLVVLLFVSFVFFLQEPFSYEIVDLGRSLNGMEIYEAVNNRFGRSLVGIVIVIVQFCIRIFLAVFVLSFLNLLNVIEFRKRYGARRRRRDNVTQRNSSREPNQGSSGAQNLSDDANEANTNGNATTKSTHSDSGSRPTPNRQPAARPSKSNSRSNRSLIRMVIFSSFMNALGTVPYSVVYIIQLIFTHDMISLFFNLSIVLLYALLALDTFVYYSFNKLYAQVLRSYFKAIRSRIFSC